jgi:hypothetical protein
MLHAGYEIVGVTIMALLIGGWALKRFFCRTRSQPAVARGDTILNDSHPSHDIQHRALMYLMSQKTESVLAALARTIEQERQKLGVIVRNPSMVEAIDAFETASAPGSENRQSCYGRILPMAKGGMAVSKIARQLHLPEAEVVLVMRLNAV